MRADALEVARQRPGEPEEAHDDDGHGQGEDRRLLGGARDQVAGGGHQPDAEAGRERPEQDRGRDPPSRNAGEGRELPHGAQTGTSLGAEPHDAVGPRLQLGTVGDEEDGAPGEQRARRRRRPLGARRVEVGGRLVQDHERGVAEERAREGDPPDLPRPRAAGRRRRRPSRSRPAAHARSRRRRPGGASRTAASGAAASPRRMLSATVPRKSVGRWAPTRPGPARRPGRSRRGRRRRRSRARRWARPGAGAARRSCSSPPARARERDRLARLELEVEVGDHRRGRGVREGDALEPHGASRGLGGVAAPTGRPSSSSARSSRRSPTARPSALAWYWAARFRSGR